MQQLIWSLLHIYPVEYTILYLLIGLGMAMQGVLSIKKVTIDKGLVGCFQVALAVPFGVILGLFPLILWPAYLAAMLFAKLRR